MRPGLKRLSSPYPGLVEVRAPAEQARLYMVVHEALDRQAAVLRVLLWEAIQSLLPYRSNVHWRAWLAPQLAWRSLLPRA